MFNDLCLILWWWTPKISDLIPCDKLPLEFTIVISKATMLWQVHVSMNNEQVNMSKWTKHNIFGNILAMWKGYFMTTCNVFATF